MSNVQYPFEGILLIDKPEGCTSHDVVSRVRRKLNMKKIGHAGTLDPMATGLLIMLVGKATKVSQYLISLAKVYEGKFLLGQTTDSYDADGEVTETKDVPELSEADLNEEMKTFVGDQYQTPPMFSAKKINGVPLYKMARKGKSVEREARFINVSRLDLLNFESPSAEFVLACSKGTYVRSIVHDLGQKIGCGAHLTALRRTEIDQFKIKDSARLEDFENMSVTDIRRLLIPIYQAVPSHVI